MAINPNENNAPQVAASFDALIENTVAGPARGLIGWLDNMTAAAWKNAADTVVFIGDKLAEKTGALIDMASNGMDSAKNLISGPSKSVEPSMQISRSQSQEQEVAVSAPLRPEPSVAAQVASVDLSSFKCCEVGMDNLGDFGRPTVGVQRQISGGMSLSNMG